MSDNTRLDYVLSKLSDNGYKPIKCGSEYRSGCPGHGGSDPNLCISTGADGKILFHCKSHGCDYKTICEGLGIDYKALMSNSGEWAGSTTERTETQSERTVYPFLNDAIAAVSQNIGKKPDNVYEYRDIDQNLCLAVCRWNVQPRKTIRPFSAVLDGFIIGTIDNRLYPLFYLPETANMFRSDDKTIRVFVCEGEKATILARNAGIWATCSHGGSGAARKTNWGVLCDLAKEYNKRLELVILPDNDEPGEKYARSIIDIFKTFKTDVCIKIARFPEIVKQFPAGGQPDFVFPDKGDFAELAEYYHANKIADSDIVKYVHAVADSVEPEIGPNKNGLYVSVGTCAMRACEKLTSDEPNIVWDVGDSSALNELKLRPDSAIIIGGGPGSGKTAFIMQLAFEVVRRNPNVRLLVCNVEMSPENLIQREYARQTGIEYSRIIDRALEWNEKQKVRAATKEIMQYDDRLFFVEPPFTMSRILEAAERANADMIVLDYIQRIVMDDKADTKDNMRLIINAIREKLSMNGKCVVMASALNRAATAGKGDYNGSGMVNLRDSSELEFGADDVYIIETSQRFKSSRTLKCYKKRNGAVVDIPLEFDGAHQNFYVPGENLFQNNFANDFVNYSEDIIESGTA